jgi:cytochrome P450
MDASLWVRWAAIHGVLRAFLSVQALRGDPLGRFLMGQIPQDERYAVMQQIRAQGRLVRTRFVWVSADHEICRTVLRDDRFGITGKKGRPKPLPQVIARTDPGLPNPVEPPAMVMTDPPEHTRYRRLVAHSFTPRAIDELSDRVTELTNELLNGLDADRQVDLLADFATPLPIAMIAEILGLPSDAWPLLLEWGHLASPLLDMGVTWTTYRRASDGMRGLDRYLRDHFEQLRRGDPDDTPFSRLAAGDALSHRELAANAALLIGAGFETTVNLIGNGIVLLLEHPQQLARLRENPDLWPNAVEEILRFHSPVQMTARAARQDVDIDGNRIAAGESVILILAGANRDPRIFEHPDRFDVTRPNARDHLAFATGVHACIGAPLARIEGSTALRSLFQRFPDLALSAPPQARGLVNLHGYQQVTTDLGSSRTTDDTTIREGNCHEH